MSNNFWIDNAEDFLFFEHPSERNVLHPLIIKKVTKFAPNTYLDYGAGDGRMTARIPLDIPIDIFDISPKMIKYAQQVLGSKLTNAYIKTRDIPQNHYDIIVCSMVLVCINNEATYEKTLNIINLSLNESGKAIFSVTHPCFRSAEFSDFHTEYSYTKKFDYFDEGKPFGVTIHNANKKKKVSFDDYHWSLSFMMNSLIKANFNITEIIETTDDPNTDQSNKLSSPFLIIIAEKR